MRIVMCQRHLGAVTGSKLTKMRKLRRQPALLY